MARQIAVSDEVYEMLTKKKSGNMSFSEVIKEALSSENKEESEESKIATERLFALMKKGYNLGKIRGTRGD